MKKWISLLLALVLLLSTATTAKAAESSDKASSLIVPMDFTYIMVVGCSLDITALGRADCTSTFICVASVDHVRISSYLQKYDGGWVNVKHWVKDAYSNTTTFSDSYYVVSGYTYRYYCYFYAYIDGSLVESTTKAAYDNY